MKCKYIPLISMAFLPFILLQGCILKPDKIKILVTHFVLYDFSKQIGQDNVEVILLPPPGTDPHFYKPSASDITNIESADLFIYTNDEMEVDLDFLDDIESKSLSIINAGEGIDLYQGIHFDGFEVEMEGTDDIVDEIYIGDYDPHVWLDPMNAAIMVNHIIEALAIKDKKNADFYFENGLIYREQLKNLDIMITDVLSQCERKKIIYTGHNSFSYFARQYGLSYQSPSSGYFPTNNNSDRFIKKMVETILLDDIEFVFHEESDNDDVAKVIAEETDAELLLLHSAHTVSQTELNSGITYLKIMLNNLEQLKSGLEYQQDK